MKMNQSALDRGLRLVGGLLLVWAAQAGTIGPWGYVGLVPLATGMFGYCPLYGLLGIRTGPATPD